MPSRVLVIPSNREPQLREFFEAWEGRGGWDAVVVVEDNPTKTFDLDGVSDCPCTHYSWREIEEYVTTSASWIFSRRDSAIRAFGFVAAHRLGAEHVLTLDDDVRPLDGCTNLFADHLRVMTTQPRWTPSVPGRRTRGLPYKNLGTLPPAAANVGLWTNAGDPDAVEAIGRIGRGEVEYFLPPPGSRVVPSGQYTNVCGMNLCVARRALPAFYFPLMGEVSRYRRYDDIWAGVIAKKLFDHLGWGMTAGDPHVEHRRASDPFNNLAAEAAGLVANETFWEAVDATLMTQASLLPCVRELGDGLAESGDTYVLQMGAALGVWAGLFEGSP